MRYAVLAAAATLFCAAAWASDSEHVIGDRCGDLPVMPVLVDGGTATSAEMDAMREKVDAFLTESDRFQMCLMRYWASRKEHAMWGRTSVPHWIEQNIKDRIAANQRDKEAVGRAHNLAVRTYRDKHPS